MDPNSLRWRLPFTYALIALITALALASVLLLMLHSYYLDQERRYLLGNARAIGSVMQLADSYDLPDEAVLTQIETLSFFTQTRVRLLDTQWNIVADSGSPMEQQILALRYEQSVNQDGPRDDSILSVGESVPAGDGIAIVPHVEREGGLLDWLLGEFSSTEPAPTIGTNQEIMRVRPAGSSYEFGLGQGSPTVPRSSMAVIAPIEDSSGNILGHVELSEGPAYGQEVIASVAWGLLIAAIAAVLMAAGIGWLISRRISAPVVALAQTSIRMTAGDLTARADVDRHDEIGVLAHAFNQMAARMEETINTLRAFVSDAAHELHTPLTALHTDLELAAVDPDPAQRVAHLERALGQVRRFEALTANLLDLSRIEAGIQEKRRAVDLSTLLAGLSEVYASRAEQAGSTLQLDLPETPLMIQGYDVSLRQALSNLLDNAIKFTPPGGQVYLRGYKDDSCTVIAITDTGIGIPAEDISHVFKRFHRGRNAASYPGSGLGLAITQSIIQAHDGMIAVQNREEGTCFEMRFNTH